MNYLEILLQPLMDSAPDPAPVTVVRERAARIRRRRRARSGGFAVVAVVALVTCVTIAVPRNRHAVRTIAPSSSISTPPVRVGSPRTIHAFGLDMVAAYGSVWLSQPDHVARLDPADGHVIATMRVPGASDIRNVAAGAGAIWVDDRRTGKLTRIDPATNRVVATISLRSGDFDPNGIAFLDGFLWVARPALSGAGGDVVAIDPATNRIVHRSVVPRTYGLFAGTEALWYVTDGDSSLVRLDPTTLRTRVVRRDVTAIAAGAAGRLWLYTASGMVEVAERGGAQIGPTIRLGLTLGLHAVVAGGVLWLGAQANTIDPGSVTPYDARTHNALARSVPLHASPPILRLVVTSGAVWVASYATNGLTRIPYTR